MKTRVCLTLVMFVATSFPATAFAVDLSKSFACPGIDTAAIVYVDTVGVDIAQSGGQSHTYVWILHGDRKYTSSLKDYIATKYRNKKVLCIIPMEIHSAGHNSSLVYRIFSTD